MGTRRLKTYADVRRYLANLINRTEKGQIDAKMAGKLGYLTGYLLRAIEGCEMTDRISKLEEKIDLLLNKQGSG